MAKLLGEIGTSTQESRTEAINGSDPSQALFFISVTLNPCQQSHHIPDRRGKCLNDTESEENVTTGNPSDNTDDPLHILIALDVPIPCPNGHRSLRGNCKKRKY
ncbi:CLUMA_CG001048, isoform A [Clunio marinus]|uniref:CLUMA_CG001048, isoform A n=1 Tax=Clunio marinus TaxID=568069 RepID=A0A1J1HLC1_9DIPT|nr:CLUMA_CG001048, isoform A [Clunio marinus]